MFRRVAWLRWCVARAAETRYYRLTLAFRTPASGLTFTDRLPGDGVYDGDEIGRVHRFAQDAAHAVDRGLRGRADDDHRDVRELANLLLASKESEPVRDGHADVEENELRQPPGRHEIECVLAVAHLTHRVARPPENLAEHEPHIGIVVDDEDTEPAHHSPAFGPQFV